MTAPGPVRPGPVGGPAAGSAEGGVSVEVGWDGARVASARVAFERPRGEALLAGRTPAEALALVPRVFALCGHAQRAAGRAALAAAGAELPADPREGERVLLEAAREHLWRLLQDWPRALGLELDPAPFAAWGRRLGAALRDGLPPEGLPELAAFVEEEVLGGPLLALASAEDALAWAERGASHAARLARAVRDEPAPALATAWLEPGAPRDAPSGVAAQTGPLARWRRQPAVAGLLAGGGRTIFAHLLARALDLSDAAARLAAPAREPGAAAEATGPGAGAARVETARGTLLHRCALRPDGRIGAYEVLPPTAWNFHARGPFAGSVVGLAAGAEEELRARIGRWALAFDPCVPWSLTVHRTSRPAGA
ncbi:MAG: hypothetical protein U0229_20520 [Anaeromyxobacter sp.]